MSSGTAFSVIGVDPGTATGVCVLTCSGTSMSPTFAWYATVLAPAAVRESMLTLLREAPNVILVSCERYIITRHTADLTQQTTALEVTGVIRDVCRERDVTFIQRDKSDTAHFATNDLLRRLGFHVTRRTVGGDISHARDAARQATLALAQRMPVVVASALRGAV